MRLTRLRALTALVLFFGLISIPSSAQADINSPAYTGLLNTNDIAINYDGSIVAVTRWDGVYVSTDFGTTWVHTLNINAFKVYVAMSSTGQYMVAGGILTQNSNGTNAVGTKVYYSSNYGSTWTERANSGSRPWSRFDISDDGTKILATVTTVSQLDADLFLEAVENGYVAYSTNSGSTFTDVFQFPTGYNGGYRYFFTGMDLVNDGSALYVATDSAGVFRSTNGGSSWSLVLSGDFNEVRASSDGVTVFASGNSVGSRPTIKKSMNSGSTWTASVDEDLTLNYADARSDNLAISANGQYVVIAQTAGDIFESRDYGRNFVLAGFIGHPYYVQIVPNGIKISGNGRYTYFNDVANQAIFRVINGADKTETPTVTSLSSTSVSLSWSAPGSNGSTITDYLIEYSSNSGSTWTNFPHTAGTATSRTVTGLTQGTTYQFRVGAVTEFGRGEFSSTVSATPSTVPETPTSISGSVGNQLVGLSWSAPSSNGGTPITNYLIEYRAGSGSWTTFSRAETSTASAVITGLTNGTSYTFRVSAINARGTGPTSNISSSFTPITTPGAPSSLAATTRNGEVLLTWSAPSDNGSSAITNYLVQYSSNSGSTWNNFSRSVSTRTSETVTSLSNGTEYSFRVSAINLVGTGTASSSVTATPSTTASAPTSLVATAGNREVSLAFTAGASGGNAISDYLVEYSSNAGSSWSTFTHTATANSPIVITGLTNYTAYVFRLTPINVNGNGATSSASASVTPRGSIASFAITRNSVGTASGAAFTTQPQITLRDQYSVTLATDSSTVVSATISAGGSLVGTTTATAVAGVVTFSNLGITGTAGTTYTISYSVAGFSALSQNVVVSVGSATKLRITRNSAGTQTSTVFTTQPIIKIVDSGNNIVTSYQNTTITSSVNNQTCFKGLVETATASSGSATFSGLSLSGASGTECLITYSASNLTSTSETVTLLAGAAAVISRTTRPDYGYYGRPFGQQPVYTITDLGGNIVTTDNTTILTVSTPNNSGSTILQETQTAVNGIVTFTGLGLSGINAGTFTQLRVTANSFSYTYSDSIFIVQGDPVLSWSNLTKLSGDAPFTVTAPTSNAAGTFAYSSSNTGVATVSGSTITIVGQGTTTLTATLTPTDTTNFASGVSVTTTLSVSAGAATVTISLPGGVVTVAKGTPIAITASVNVTGRVSFYINGKPIGGCTSRHTTSTVSCAWKPAIQGQSVTLSALLRPSSGNYTNARSNLLQVGVGRRTGRR